MSQNVSDYLLRRLQHWGVQRVFAYPGDGINGIVAAFGRNDGIQFVQVRHEEMAAFMACAHAKFSGEVGVCLATSGPGAIHLLNGLYDAKMDHQPVVAIVGQQARAALGGDYQQEVDLQNLFKDVAHEFVHTAMVPTQMRQLLDRAFRTALATRSPTVIIVPKDVQEMDAVEKSPHAHGTVHTGIGYVSPRVLPCEEDLQRAAEVLNAGERVAMLVGAGCLHARDEVKQIAELLGAGVAKALLGKSVLPDDLPYVTGAIGLLGTKPSWDMMNNCDTLFIVGSSFPYSEFLPKEGQARGVQIDIDGRMLSLRYPMEIALTGDSAQTLRALIPMIRRKRDDSWRQWIETLNKRWWKVLEARAKNVADPLNPQLVFWELSNMLPNDVILSSDSGSAANWFARDLRLRAEMKSSLSGNLATMGCGVPYAIAAKLAFPARPVIALVGDGAMQMNGSAELLTIAKYWRDWSDPRLIVLVLNNRDLNQVTWELRAMGGDPKYVPSQSIPDFAYAQYAEQIGLRGIRMEKPADVRSGWQRALESDRPVVIDARVDPNVPPLPPHIKVEQAMAYMRAIAKGDPDSWGIIQASFRDMIESYIPHPGK